VHFAKPLPAHVTLRVRDDVPSLRIGADRARDRAYILRAAAPGRGSGLSGHAAEAAEALAGSGKAKDAVKKPTT
jgi:hypothetical protein